MARILVTHEDLARIEKLLVLFGAVRRKAFASFIESYFDCSEEAARKIVRTITKRKIAYSPKNTYTGWQILKKDSDVVVDVDKMDAFETYVEMFKSNNPPSEYEDDEERVLKFIHVGKREFPYDFTFAADFENIYRVILFDDSGYQKLSFASKDTEKWGDEDVLLVIIPSRYNPDSEQLKIAHKHRISVVRTQKRKVACKLSDIIDAEQ